MIAKELIIQPASLSLMKGEFSTCAYQVTTDSRKIINSSLFIALKGEKFDAHDFIPEILKRGLDSLAFVCDEKWISLSIYQEWVERYPQHVFILVSDCYRYLAELGKICRLDWQRRVPSGKLIGITGSNGKTTTKEMVAHVLRALVGEGNVLATKGNLNNHIGVPLTLFELTDQQFAIIEMGTNHPGEIPYLVQIADPDIGVVTSIGKSHLEFFHTVENVFKEKRTLLDHVLKKDSGHVVINNDDSFLSQIHAHSFQASRFSTEVRDDSIYVSYFSHGVNLNLQGTSFEIMNESLLGRHNFINMAAAFLICRKLLPQKEREIASALSTFIPSLNRSQWIDKGELKIFSDAYNANPSSMQSSLQAFTSFIAEKKIDWSEVQVVMADMNELGETAMTEHRLMGEIARDYGVQMPVFIGRFSLEYQNGFKNSSLLFQSTEEFLKTGKELLRNKKYLFLKGSRTLQLERILDITL